MGPNGLNNGVKVVGMSRSGKKAEVGRSEAW